MRINKISLAGVALALIGVSAKEASAGDVTISGARTTPVTTSAADGVSAGNVTVASGGSITVGAGQAAITVNSNNTVTNTGALNTKDANNSTGIAIQTTGVGSPFTGTVTHNGSINLGETYVQVDTDGDGDLDGPYAQGTNRVGIWLEPGGSFNGDITEATTSSITIQGNNSTGVRLDGVLNGNLTSAGSIAVVGDNSQGIAINGGAAGGVTGNVSMAGTLSVRGQNAVGVLVDAPIAGAMSLTANVTVTGFHSTSRPLNATAAALLDADDFLLSGPAFAIQNNVLGGFTVFNDTTNSVVGAISSFSTAPALLIRPNLTTPTNVTIGATSSGFGVLNQGSITAIGIFDGFDAGAVRIEGAGGATVNIVGGFENASTINSTAFEGNSTAFFVGQGATVPNITNLGGLTAVSNSQTAKNAIAIDIGSGGTLNTISNGASISAQVFGSIGNATAIRDQSNTLSLITNNGSISGQVIATDPDLTDNIPAPPVTGSAVAIDVSASTIGVTLTQQTPTTAAAVPLQILGDVRFGSGADTFNLLNGTMLGNLSFGAGADTFVIDNGASFAGKLTDSDGLLSLNVANGTLGLAGGTTNLTTAHFGGSAVLGVLLTTTPSTSTFIHSTGTITFDSGATIVPVVPTGLPVSGTNIFLTASGGLVGASNVIRTVSGSNTPFIYNFAIQGVTGDPNSLQAAYVLKTPAQLGLTPNQTIAYQPVLAALRTDANASAAFSSLDTQATFENAYTQLLPNYASAAAELAATAIQQSQGATANRLDTLRIHDSHDISVWGQEIGYQLRRDPGSLDGVKYDGWGFGLAVGIDGPLRNGQMFGLSASFLTSETTQPARRDGELSSSIGQFNAYLGSGLGPIDLDLLGGVGLARLSSRRFVEFGTFKAQADADWWAGEGHAAIRASLPMQMASWLEFRPFTNFTYVAMDEQGYKESGGGTAINLDVDGTFSQRLWADAGVEFAGHFGRPGLTQFSPRMTIGYRANLIDDAAKRTLHFDSSATDFTLTDATEGEGGAILGLGMEASNGYSTFSLFYEGQFSDQIQRNSINAALRFRF